MPFFSLLRFDRNKTRNNAFCFCSEKRNLFDFKKQNFLLRFDQNKTRNNVSDFAMKKETFFDFKKQNFSNF